MEYASGSMLIVSRPASQSSVLQAQNITRTFRGGQLGKFDLNGANDRHRGRFMECRKVCCATDELGKLWSVEYELTKEGHQDGFKNGSIDLSIRAIGNSQYIHWPY